MADRDNPLDWNADDDYWRTNYSTRPYATGGTARYDDYRPGYRYGFESAHQYKGRNWEDVESDLELGWDKYEHRGKSTWQQIRSAARDAWDRVMGRTPVGSR